MCNTDRWLQCLFGLVVLETYENELDYQKELDMIDQQYE